MSCAPGPCDARRRSPCARADTYTCTYTGASSVGWAHATSAHAVRARRVRGGRTSSHRVAFHCRWWALKLWTQLATGRQRTVECKSYLPCTGVQMHVRTGDRAVRGHYAVRWDPRRARGGAVDSVDGRGNAHVPRNQCAVVSALLACMRFAYSCVYVVKIVRCKRRHSRMQLYYSRTVGAIICRRVRARAHSIQLHMYELAIRCGPYITPRGWESVLLSCCYTPF